MCVESVYVRGGIELELKEGKPPHQVLEDIVFKHTGAFDPDLVQGPGIGEDAGIIRLGEGFLVAHSDPITAATKFIGWLAVHVAANDVAVRGVRPRWLLLTILLPPGSSTSLLKEIMEDVDRAAKSIGATVIGGHTEVTPGVPRPLLISTAIGHTTGRVVRTRDACSGDYVVVVGRVGGEGASVIAWDFSDLLLEHGVSRGVVEEARRYVFDISIVDKALSIRDYVSSMHDPTEGGVIQGLLELALASKKTIVFDKDSLVIEPVVEEVSSALDIDPYKLLSSGSLIATVSENNLDIVIDILKSKGYRCYVCGRVVDGPSKLVVKEKNSSYTVKESVVDEIYRLWK